MDYEQFQTFMEQWIAENGGRYTSVHSGSAIDAAITAVKNKEAVWDARMIPPGGLQGQALVKKSDADFDVEWSYSVAPPLSIYGVTWDGSAATTWTRTDAAADFADPVPYVAGASEYGSPFDDLMPWSGMVRSTDPDAGEVVAIPKFWYLLEQTSGNGLSIKIADRAVPGYSVSPAHMDRGDGKGERDVVYVGRYHCGSSAYKSVSGQTPKVSVTRSAARTAIHNLGTDIWQMDFAMRFTIWLLYIVEFANWDSQSKIGYGCGNNRAAQAMGYTDSMQYHTGTTQSSRTTYGLGTQYRNIEGLWDNVREWMDGCYYNSSGMNVILNPSKFSDTAKGTVIGTPTGGYPSAFTVKSVSGAFPTFIPTTSSGSTTTYSCDGWNFDTSNPCLYVGGSYHQNPYYGLFCVACATATVSYEVVGSRLMILPAAGS